MAHHAVSPLLATGSADHGIRVWDSEKSFCTHNFKGIHGGIPTQLMFHPDPKVMWLFSGGEDGSIAIWDMIESRSLVSLKNGHVSAITSLSVAPSGRLLLSAGRDQVINIWSLPNATGKSNAKPIQPLMTIPVLECVNAACFLTDDLFCTAGEQGIIKIWSCKESKCIKSSITLCSKGHGISQMKLINKSTEIVAISTDFYIFVIDASTLKLKKTFVGHLGEVTDIISYGERLAVGTNGPEIRLFPLTGNNVELLRGHEEAVICLASHQEYLLSGSRDGSAIIWKSSSDIVEQVQRLTGHTDVVSAVTFTHGKKELAAITASADFTIKLWTNKNATWTPKWTVKAHDKDINAALVTPNDRHLISASQDKTCKIWKLEDGSHQTTLTGHKRGIWAVALSPVEQVVATASADRTLKLWSLTSGSCLKTFEGHANSVLKVAFIKEGRQLLSADSDGLLKVWDIRSGECMNTFEGHSDRIWSMLVMGNGENLVTGDASGLIKVWRDVTEQVRNEAISKRDELILVEQQLSNMILRKEYHNAVLLAMQMQQPHRLYSLFGQLIDGVPMQEALQKTMPLISAFSSEQMVLLCGYIRDWNSSLKRAYVAHVVLRALIQLAIVSSKVDIFSHLEAKEMLRQILAYSEKHYSKVDGLIINSYMIDFILKKLDELVPL